MNCKLAQKYAKFVKCWTHLNKNIKSFMSFSFQN